MSKKKKTIEIKCKGADLLPYDSLIQFQGDLKTLSKTNLNKLKTRIVKRGFRIPFYIWVHKNQNKIIDGHQRDKVLKSLKEDGYEIPLLPVVYIYADNEQDARETILENSSQYGEWNETELEEWLFNINSDINNTLRFVDKEIKESLETEDYGDLDKQMKDLDGMDAAFIIIKIPAKYKDELEKWIANGEQHTQTGFGKGLLKRCELL